MSNSELMSATMTEEQQAKLEEEIKDRMRRRQMIANACPIDPAEAAQCDSCQ